MYISSEGGPRGEAYVDRADGVLEFASTSELFAYITRADVGSRLESAYVQNTARIDWSHPSDAADSFIDARKAYYVAWQPLPGETGPTFAPFAKRSDADAFVHRYGGGILRFDQITSSLVSNLDYSCPGPKSPLFEAATRAHCVSAGAARRWIRTFR